MEGFAALCLPAAKKSQKLALQPAWEMKTYLRGSHQKSTDRRKGEPDLSLL